MSLYMMPCLHATAPSSSSAERLFMPPTLGRMIEGGSFLGSGIGTGEGSGEGLGDGIIEGDGDGTILGLGEGLG